MLSQKLIETINDSIELAAKNIIAGYEFHNKETKETGEEWDPFILIMTNVQSPVRIAIDFTILKDEPVRKILRDCVPDIKLVMRYYGATMAPSLNLPIMQREVEGVIRTAIAQIVGIKAYNELDHASYDLDRLRNHIEITERIKNA